MSLNFYFPVLLIHADFEEDSFSCENVVVAKRKWQTSIFDFATLATKHEVNFPYTLMDPLLNVCNIELCVCSEETRDDAIRGFTSFQLGLYVAGSSPFLNPFVSTHSINEYSGINSRDSEILQSELPEDLQSGAISRNTCIKFWPHELSLQCITVPDWLGVTAHQCEEGAKKGSKWRSIASENDLLRVAEEAALVAPKIGFLDQSLLHIWSGIESLFPRVNSEVVFRISLNLAQLCSTNASRMDVFKRAKRAYATRSKVAHGQLRGIRIEDWMDSWKLLMLAIDSIIERGGLPGEDELMTDIFWGPEGAS